MAIYWGLYNILLKEGRDGLNIMIKAALTDILRKTSIEYSASAQSEPEQQGVSSVRLRRHSQSQNQIQSQRNSRWYTRYSILNYKN